MTEAIATAIGCMPELDGQDPGADRVRCISCRTWKIKARTEPEGSPPC